MKKDAMIIGCYPNTDTTKEMLKNCINTLKDDFDIILCTHYPADVETQKLVKYYIYDHRNEIVKNEAIHFWCDNLTFYYEGYLRVGNGHHAYAVYRNIMNAVAFLDGYYDCFYYTEGDCEYSKQDVQKMKDIKTNCKLTNKKAWFYHNGNGTRAVDYLGNLFWYSETAFFKEVFPFPKTRDEYVSMANSMGSFGIIENFYYCVVDSKNKFDDIFIVSDIQPADYFDTSKTNIHSFFGDDDVSFPFEIEVTRIEGESGFAVAYVNGTENLPETDVVITVNGQYFDTFPRGKQMIAKRLPSTEGNTITLGVGKYNLNYQKSDLVKGRSFVRFK